MMVIKLAWQQFWAQWRAGDVRVLLLALIVAVTAITGVSFFTSRIGYQLNNEGGLVLGGDMVMLADHAIAQQAIDLAVKHRLRYTTTAEFPSMAIVGEHNQLAEIKALNIGFPLRGNFTVQYGKQQQIQTLATIPSPGHVWLEPRLANLLNVKIGDVVELGAIKLTIEGILIREPSRGGDMFSFAPRLMMNAVDLEKTQLIQYGSRVKYQLLVAGDAQAIHQFGETLRANLQAGERIQDLKTARPEIRSALDKAETFLGLAAMVSILLSIAAMLLASNPYIARHIQTAALLRCFGASKQQIQHVILWQCAFIAFLGASVGSVLGYLLQYLLANIAGKLFLETLPAPDLSLVYLGYLVSFFVLFALIIPHMHAIKQMSVVRILRSDVETKTAQSMITLIPVMIVVMVIMLMVAKTVKLALMMILAMVGVCLLTAGLAFILAHFAYLFSQSIDNRSGWRNMVKLGLANLKRNRMLTIVQVVGFGLGTMVLVLLMIVKNDLLNNWQNALPPDAPNRFMINIQASQTNDIQDFIQHLGIQHTQIFPMIRGRLIQINQQPVSAEQYEDERAKRLVSREFNLSMMDQLQSDNQLIAGQWWQQHDVNKPLVSIEQDIATALNIKIGDVLTYDIAGSTIQLSVSSIRKVDWDSMRANFFAVTPLETLASYPKSFMTAFYLKNSQSTALDALVKQFPNLTIINVASLMEQVRGIMNKMSLAVAYVFGLCLVAGLIVLYAALIATRDTRAKEAALLRVFGASRKQVTIAIMAEYTGLAFIAVTVGLLMANTIAFYVSVQLFDISYSMNVMMNLIAYSVAMLLIPLTAWFVIKAYLEQPPKQILNSI